MSQKAKELEKQIKSSVYRVLVLRAVSGVGIGNEQYKLLDKKFENRKDAGDHAKECKDIRDGDEVWVFRHLDTFKAELSQPQMQLFKQEVA